MIKESIKRTITSPINVSFKIQLHVKRGSRANNKALNKQKLIYYSKALYA
jgi:hypothetical protein